MFMSIASFWLSEGLVANIIPKREVNALFIWISRKIKVLELKIGSELDTTSYKKEDEQWIMQLKTFVRQPDFRKRNLQKRSISPSAPSKSGSVAGENRRIMS